MAGKREEVYGPCVTCGERPALKRLTLTYQSEPSTEYAVGCACWERYLYFTDSRVETFLPDSWEVEA